MLLGKPLFIKMNTIQIKSLKGFNSFSSVYTKGKKIKIEDLFSVFVFRGSKLNFKKCMDEDIFYVGVGSSKRANKKAVTRNRIKRLLRVSVLQTLSESHHSYDYLKYAVFVYNKRIEQPQMIHLSDIKPLVQQIFEKVNNYNNKLINS